MTGKLPESIALRPDPELRRDTGDGTLLGGSPLRLLRFAPAAAGEAAELLDGRPVGSDDTAQVVARRLLDSGMAHPVPDPGPTPSCVVVVPVRDHSAPLAVLLDRLAPLGLDVVVVDDGSRDPGSVATVVGDRADLRRNESPAGPGGARDVGWRSATADVVVFLDADVVPPEDDWLPRLLAYFQDPAVGAVAPRVRSLPGSSVLARYERGRSPLDLGAREARVAPGSRVSYVPTAALAVRRATLEVLDGFDPALLVGEDVDLVWRAVEAGWTVRYQPQVVFEHAPRSGWADWARQRRAYGSAAAPLEERHPGATAPVALNQWSLAAWALAALGGPVGIVAGSGITAWSASKLAGVLRGRVDDPVRTAAELAGLGTLRSGEWLARASWRAWLPMAAWASIRSRRVRRTLVLAAIVTSEIDRRSTGSDLHPARYALVHAADDAAYCTGVWRGVFRSRSLRCLAPRFTGISGVTD